MLMWGGASARPQPRLKYLAVTGAVQRHRLTRRLTSKDILSRALFAVFGAGALWALWSGR